MQGNALMVKAAQKRANRRTGHQKNDFSLCGADTSKKYEDSGYVAVLTDGQHTVTADNYSGAQRTGALQEDCTIADGRVLLEGCNENDSRPCPVLLEGKEVDLLQLCTEVTARGGYEKVTDASLWSSISDSIGCGQKCGAAVKLVYAKYLRALETNKVMLKNGEDVYSWVAKYVEESSSGLPDSDVIGSGMNISPDSSMCNQESNGEVPAKRRKISYSNKDHALRTSVPAYSLKGTDSLVGMVEWLRRLALNPGDPKKGQGPRGSTQNETWADDCCSMVMNARAALWGRKELIYYGSLAGNTAKQRIPPAVYYKELPKPNTRTLEKLRANQTRAMKCGLHFSADTTEAQAVRPSWLHQTSSPMLLGNGHYSEHGHYLSSDYVKSMNEALSIGYLLNNKATRKRIPIGPHFQAQIPPWTGKAANESDGLDGVRVWPSSDRETAASDFGGRVGRGRPLQCACAYPMSQECVRLHVALEREKLNKEIGDAFNSWGFNDMGESVSARWTKKEELAFDATVKSNPLSLGKDFWDELPAALPIKTMKELVSYYFNVFVVRRRAIENRTMPDSIDSDDDERELSSSGTSSAFARNMLRQCQTLAGITSTYLALSGEVTLSSTPYAHGKI